MTWKETWKMTWKMMSLWGPGGALVGAAIKYGPGAINFVNTWGPAIKHCVSSCRL